MIDNISKDSTENWIIIIQNKIKIAENLESAGSCLRYEIASALESFVKCYLADGNSKKKLISTIDEKFGIKRR